MAEVVWTPDEATLAHANVTRLMRRHGLESYTELLRRSQEEPEWFWPAVVEDLGLDFSQPWERVCDDSRGPEWTTWFTGATLSIARNCVHRWAERDPARVGAVFTGEDGSRRELTFAELSRDVTRLAEGLVRLGVEPGDRVAIYLPMSPEVAVASHACAHIGAVQVPLFSGFAAPAVVQRLRDSEAKVVITADYSLRRGARLPMRETVEEAVREAPSVEHVVTWERDAGWGAVVDDSPGELEPLEVDAEHPYLLTYTSGTTGKPKGVLHVQGGFLVSIAREVAYQADVHPEDVLHFSTDMGWIMGPWAVVGGGALGCTLVFAEGAPDRPARPPLAARRVRARLGARPLADPRPRSHPPWRARGRPLVAPDPRDDRRAVEPRPLSLALRARGRSPLPDHQLLRGDRGGGVLPLTDAGDADQGVLPGRARARDGNGRRRCRGRSRWSAPARLASSSAAGPSRA